MSHESRIHEFNRLIKTRIQTQPSKKTKGKKKAHMQRAEEPAKDPWMLHTGNAAVAKINRTLGKFKKFPLFFSLFCFVFCYCYIKRNILTTSRICWKPENDRLALLKRTKPVGFTRSGIFFAQSNHLQNSSTGQKENHVLAIKQTKLYVSDRPDVRRIKWKTREWKRASAGVSPAWCAAPG